MADRPKYKMAVEERAKQFMPFSPLSGLGMALLKKEREKAAVKKKTLADDKKEELNRKICSLGEGSDAQIMYYKDGKYIKFAGRVRKILKDKKIIVTEKDEIKFSDIWDIIIK